MAWYQVIKTINGRKYLYLQTTYRENGKVKTKNKYLGPAVNNISFSSEPRAIETIVEKLEEAQTLRDILKDLVQNHRAKFFLKFRGRLDRQSIGGTSFAELNAHGLKTGGKAKLLDTYLSEYGFADFDELDESVAEYYRTREQLKDAQTTLNELRKERAAANAYHRAVGSRQSASKNIQHDQPKPKRERTRQLKPAGGLKIDKIRRHKPNPRHWRRPEDLAELRRQARENETELAGLGGLFNQLFNSAEREDRLIQKRTHHLIYRLQTGKLLRVRPFKRRR